MLCRIIHGLSCSGSWIVCLYPDAKFILTYREADAWINSIISHFGSDGTPMRRWIYGFGSPRGHEQVYLERYLRHNGEVKNYFRDRSQDLLVWNLTAESGWVKLCQFLERTAPDIPFPHLNERSRNRRYILPRQLGNLLLRFVN